MTGAPAGEPGDQTDEPGPPAGARDTSASVDDTSGTAAGPSGTAAGDTSASAGDASGTAAGPSGNTGDAGGAPVSPTRRYSPAVRRAVAGVLGLLVVAVAAGHAFTPLLLRESPVLLLAVLSSYAQMGLASARVDPVTFVVVAALRRWAGEVIAFAAGRVFGEEGVAWFEQRAATAQQSAASRRFREALNTRWWLVRDAVVLVIPHPLISAAVGAAGMPPLRFLVLKLLGSVGSVIVFWRLAGAAALPLGAAAAFVETNALVLTAAAVTVTAIWLGRRRRRPRPDLDLRP